MPQRDILIHHIGVAVGHKRVFRERVEPRSRRIIEPLLARVRRVNNRLLIDRLDARLAGVPVCLRRAASQVFPEFLALLFGLFLECRTAIDSRAPFQRHEAAFAVHAFARPVGEFRVSILRALRVIERLKLAHDFRSLPEAAPELLHPLPDISAERRCVGLHVDALLKCCAFADLLPAVGWNRWQFYTLFLELYWACLSALHFLHQRSVRHPLWRR